MLFASAICNSYRQLGGFEKPSECARICKMCCIDSFSNVLKWVSMLFQSVFTFFSLLPTFTSPKNVQQSVFRSLFHGDLRHSRWNCISDLWYSSHPNPPSSWHRVYFVVDGSLFILRLFDSNSFSTVFFCFSFLVSTFNVQRP